MSSPARAWPPPGPPYDDVLDPINRVLLPRADIATETLVARLNELGWEAEDVTAYRTVRAAPPPAPIREAIKGGGFDAVLFTSSSTVRNLIGIAGKPHAVTVIAVIGPQTAKTAAEFGLRVDVDGAQPSVTGPGRRAGRVRAPGPAGRRRRGRGAGAQAQRAPPRARRRRAPVNRGMSTPMSAVPRRPAAQAAPDRRAAPAGRAGQRPAIGPGAADVRQGGHQRAAAGRLHAGRGPAHPGQPAQGGRRGGGRPGSAA